MHEISRSEIKEPLVLRPLIERLGDDILVKNISVRDRKVVARWICDYLRTRDKKYLTEYYRGLEYLLNDPEYRRILLYIPFEELIDAPENFKKVYMRAWWHLTHVKDAAENFHWGDTFEIEARPGGDLSRVVKCGHLVPWLISSNFLSGLEVSKMFYLKLDSLLLRSIEDTFDYMIDHSIMPKDVIDLLRVKACELPPKKIYKPLFITSEREKWLKEKKEEKDHPPVLITPNALLEGPFSPNLRVSNIENFAKELGPNDILFVGGSRLKGYGTYGSDFDSWKLRDLEEFEDMYPGSPHAAHIYFNTCMIAGHEIAKDVDDLLQDILYMYDDPEVRKQSIERLESDLLQYRLLHKGFSRMTGSYIFETSMYPDMDGDCPFYNDDYRRIATMLYAKYVFIPKLD